MEANNAISCSVLLSHRENHVGVVKHFNLGVRSFQTVFFALLHSSKLCTCVLAGTLDYNNTFVPYAIW